MSGFWAQKIMEITHFSKIIVRTIHFQNCDLWNLANFSVNIFCRKLRICMNVARRLVKP